MSASGPRGDRMRGRGVGRGRGRGRGRTTVWEWESYTPGPEVYNSLWRIRKEPAIVTQRLPHDCPIPNARTRIVDRRQTEGDIQRTFYVVEITRWPSHVGNGSDTLGHTEGEHIRLQKVDLSRILKFVSPRQLEAFENEQFSIEAEAEAVARRADAEELAQKRLEKNARESGMSRGRGRGRGRANRILSGLGLHGTARGAMRGGASGRPTTGRETWRGRDTTILSTQGVVEDDPMELDSRESLHREEELVRVIAETESEDDLDEHVQLHSSPGLMRSAFVANSALSVSPVASYRKPSVPRMLLGQPEVPDIDDTESELEPLEAVPKSNPAMPPLFGEYVREGTVAETQEEDASRSKHRSKRRRTESSASDLPPHTTHLESLPGREDASSHTLMFRNESSLPEHESESEPKSVLSFVSLPARSSSIVHPSPQTLLFRNESSLPDYEGDSLDEFITPESPPFSPPRLQSNGHSHVLENKDMTDTLLEAGSHTNNDYNDLHNGEAEKDAIEGAEDYKEEYVIETITEHYYDDAGIKFYLVKWAGYEDSHDWLSEEDLAGAAELVEEYNEKIRRIKGKHKAK